ncbi:SAM-dependent methyltransferase [Priestia taiwanensis]|uniref:Methyltransferase n=1 Tax=Priestia taiwanensis TaxID=1347902 RepID=A0A917ETK1_9BACI|nr:methyltransferase [Priestia taiwanensis]MBM7364743.1 SAM-dependent methyltransferase [Priestia taiwanensis]GGE79274.1 methyltransferase [Priestia taiwanensis]
MKKQDYDKVLNITTTGEQVGFNKVTYYHRYEATPYEGLELLCQQYEMTSKDHVVDFGCGKGRLNFYLHYHYGATVTGVEMNDDYYCDAIENKKRYAKKVAKGTDNIHFYHGYAEDYVIQPSDNKFYFFNPFSINIFRKITANILCSVEEVARDVELIFYYPSEEYIFYLENSTPFEYKQEIILPGLYKNNDSERFVVYRLTY